MVHKYVFIKILCELGETFLRQRPIASSGVGIIFTPTFNILNNTIYCSHGHISFSFINSGLHLNSNLGNEFLFAERLFPYASSACLKYFIMVSFSFFSSTEAFILLTQNQTNL